MPTEIHRRVEALRRGEYAPYIARLSSGWLVAGDPQVLPGYCLLYPDPVVPHLNALDSSSRLQLLSDMTRIGDVLLEITGAARINYEILGNLEPALHAHIIPRYVDEDESLRTKPIWFYDWNAAPPFNPLTHGDLLRKIRVKLSGDVGT